MGKMPPALAAYWAKKRGSANAAPAKKSKKTKKGA